MAKNSFFKHTSNEQQVVEDLTIESIQIHGQDMVYIPRTLVNQDVLFGEDSISEFTSGTEIEMYVESVTGNKITVKRAQDNTTIQNHVKGAQILGINYPGTDDNALIQFGDDFGFDGTIT